jgi:hypothetical protein
VAQYIRHPLIYTWLLLATATLFSCWLGSGNTLGSPKAQVLTTLAILLIAIIKCRLVIRNYMEVRFAPRWLQLTCDAWLVLNFAMLSALCAVAG